MLKLSEEKFEQSIGYLKKTFNTETLEKVVGAVQAVKSLGDENELTEQFMDAAMKVQNTYNSCLDGVDKFLAESQAVYDITEYLKKKSIGEVSNRDASFDVDAIDTSSVIV